MKKSVLLNKLGDISESVNNLLGDSNLLTVVKDVQEVANTIDALIDEIDEEQAETEPREA